MARAVARIGALTGVILVLLFSAAPATLAGSKPPSPLPKELKYKKWGIDKETGEYCDRQDKDAEKRAKCRLPKPCEVPGQTCKGEAVNINEELARLEGQRRTDAAVRDDDELYESAKKCIKDRQLTAAECIVRYQIAHPKFKSRQLWDWAADQISEAAADALKEAATKLGESVVWLLQEFAIAFNDISTIDLNKTGLSLLLGVTTAVSAIIAAFLLLLQFAKLAISQRGGPVVTALTGLAKWGSILGVYLFATQVALDWSDTFSTALINESFTGRDANDTAEVKLQTRLGEMFAGLIGGSGTGSLITGGGIAVGTVGFVIVISILCIIAIGALWLEMLIRQAAIMILVAVMPIVLAGQMADATREWWPKARNALITLILMKPVIVICFSVGFGAMADGEGVRNVLVGLLIFILAASSWPALAQFMAFTSSGGGGSAASGLLSSAGTSISSAFGGNRASLGGAGMAGGGTAYTKALEADNDRSAGGSGSMSTAGGGGGGRGFWSKAMTGTKSGAFGQKLKGGAGVGMQLAALGQNTLESTAANTAANAGLGHGASGGRHAVVPASSPGDGAQGAEDGKPPTSAPLGGSTAASPTPGGPPPAAAPPLPSSSPTSTPCVSPPASAAESERS